MPRILILSNPRSGSNLLKDLLNSHPEVHFEPELLNDEEVISGCPIAHLDKTLSSFSETFVGFKVFPEQLFERGLNLSELVKGLGISQIVVLWREGLLESLTSRRIADKTGVWYVATNEVASQEKIAVEPEDFAKYQGDLVQDWGKIGTQWPSDMTPVFVKFEDLVANPMKEIRRILSRIACPVDGFVPSCNSKRQNYSKLQDKIENFADLPEDCKNAKLDVKGILEQQKVGGNGVLSSFPLEVQPYVPDKEPSIPEGGWTYRVADPLLTPSVKLNVFDALESGSISSAGFWPRLMASKLKEILGVPVVQPTCNGFTALLLALQAADVGEGDEVLMPSMTMVAVPNSAYFARATPVFVDCAPGGAYNPGLKEFIAAATEKTKALIVTHTYGVPTPDMEAIATECRKRGWTLIEDISEAVGVTTSEGRLLGTFGDFSCASMYINKMVHAGDGGFVSAKDAKFAAKLTSLVNHGFTPSYHFVHFVPSANAKINGVGAAIACGTIDELPKVMSHRSHIASLYRRELEGLGTKLMPSCGPLDTPWVFGLVCKSKEERTSLRAFLATKGVETRDFFFALHLQPAFYKEDAQRLSNAEVLGSTGFYLPTHSNLRDSDILYISSCIKAYFNPSLGVLEVPSQEVKEAVLIPPGSFSVEVRAYNPSGSLRRMESRSHLYFDAVALGIESERVMIQERWDAKALLIEDIKALMKRATEDLGQDATRTLNSYFEPYLSYFESQTDFEPEAEKPWRSEDASLRASLKLADIPTTTDEETLQLLAHIVKSHRPENVWEIGCWMGHASFLMAGVSEAASLRNKIFSCDAFRWQKWMERFTSHPKLASLLPEQSFLPAFQEFTKEFEDRVEAVRWPYDIKALPQALQNQRPDLIFLDITQEEDDLEHIWTLIKPNLIPGKTVLLFNGLAYSSIPFFTKHSDELQAFAKPWTLAKAFLYKPQVTKSPLTKRLNFQTDPEWSHHHKNLFCSSMSLLREKYHDPSAPILFFPAVEEAMCNDPQLFRAHPWVGVIHSVPSYPSLFYAPDLERLCSQERYAPLMANCKGLFTLTQVQAKYLRANLPKGYGFPIQELKYPVEEVLCDPWRKSSEHEGPLDLVFVGSFARDFQLFFDVEIPSGMQKVLVAGDEDTQLASQRAPASVKILPRLQPEEYEAMLRKSLIFLSLEYDGAANTLVLECIARNVPIVAPRMASCVEYLGKDYPLLYDPKEPKLPGLLNLSNIEKAIDFLKTMDKSQLSPAKMIKSFEEGAVLASVPSSTPNDFDVTVCICSYKRTHHLPGILDSLWNSQDFGGRVQIVVWNNNHARAQVVQKICSDYVEKSSKDRSLEVISSSANYFCSIRFAMPALMKSDALLICDDDIVPGPNFISFFLSAHGRHQKDVLCVRGHAFLPHELNVQDPSDFWTEYENLRFKDDEASEQFIHFVHADACLIPREALREVASVPMPDPTFDLVDDYWMSYVLNSRFGRKLRKLSTKDCKESPIGRTEDSDQEGLALHTRPEVFDARVRLYVHHMVKGWPVWEDECPKTVSEEVKEAKNDFWVKPQLGYNVSSRLSLADIESLSSMGVKSVRIGAVGVGKEVANELNQLSMNPDEEIARLQKTIALLGQHGISTVLVLHRRLAIPSIWRLLASAFKGDANVVGYDLINEPFTQTETDLHWLEVQATKDPNMDTFNAKYKTLIQAVREVDAVTPIIIEPSFWGRCYALSKLDLKALNDSNLVVSFHFYEPMLLTQRMKNKGRFSFPGEVPVYDGAKFSETFVIDEAYIHERFEEAQKWGKENGVTVVLGECGIARDTKGAKDYLSAIFKSLKSLGMSGFVYSWRDVEWDAMNYEFGPNPRNYSNKSSSNNELLDEIVQGITSFNNN